MFKEHVEYLKCAKTRKEITVNRHYYVGFSALSMNKSEGRRKLILIKKMRPGLNSYNRFAGRQLFTIIFDLKILKMKAHN